MVLWFYGYTASLGVFGIFKTFLPTDPIPWLVSTQNLLGLDIITRAIYHKGLGDVPSMLMEICRIVPKWSPTPVPPPPCPGLTFPDFRDFPDFFARRPRPLVRFDLKFCVFVASLGLSTMKVWAMPRPC